MPIPLDLLSGPEFTDRRLSESINVLPAVTGRLAQLGVYTDTPIATTYAKIGLQEDTLTIIPSRERGGPTNKNMGFGRSTVMVQIPHFPLDDLIGTADLQNLLGWGEGMMLQTLASVVNDKLAVMRGKHDQTAAHLDWGGLNGIILDAAGFELLDTFDAFGITQPTFAIDLATAGTDVAGRNRALKSTISAALKGMPSTGVRVFASPEYFDSYVSHPNVAEAYRYYSGGTNPARDDITDSFTHAGVTLERVDETFDVRQADNTFLTRPAIPAGEAIAIPMGTGMFRRYLAPPDTIFDANSAPNPADRVHVSTEDLPHGKGREIHTESNMLPICLRPQLLMRVTQ